MIATHKEQDTFVPHYSVSSLRDETTYSIPLEGVGGDGSRIAIKFRFQNRPDAKESPPENYHGIKVDFALEVKGKDGELLASVPVEKEDLVTLQKLLTSILEHSTVRRFQWFVEVQSEAEAVPG